MIGDGLVPFQVRATEDGEHELIDSDGVTVMADTREGATVAELDAIAAWWNGDERSDGVHALERILTARLERRREVPPGAEGWATIGGRRAD